MQYNHGALEKKWQQRWKESGAHSTADAVPGKENYMLLVEFPYPSGNLHIGHWYAFTGPDILGRFLRTQGKNVMFPIGFDAFGLPAENAAIKNKVNPRAWTEGNISTMKTQLETMGNAFDWSREVQTIDPAYYRWTQWMFVQFFKRGLIERRLMNANWCPSCKTVIANEQVNNGVCERCCTSIEVRKLPQWVMKITQYADRLVDDLDALQWPEHIKESQRNWIGRSHGVTISFKTSLGVDVSVFTTRADTLYGVTFVALAPEHALVASLLENATNVKELTEYIQNAKGKTELERQEQKIKTGACVQGVYALHPLTGENIPVYIADYVLGGYGTGAVMGVPAHDERDFVFAQTYALPVLKVVESAGELPTTIDGVLVHSGIHTGLNSAEARTAIATDAGGTLATNYRLRDWSVSRQRYWGVPIPMVHCAQCGAQPVAETELPVLLPEIDDYLPTEDGRAPLARATAWMHTTCPHCHGPAERDVETMDTFVDSSWYYLRYCDPQNQMAFASTDTLKKWLPVSWYIGGSEHTTMHVLYSRFWHKVLFDMGLVPTHEPYEKRFNRGLIMGPDGQKMSKSKGNVVDPDAQVALLGADTVRMYLAFIGPYNTAGSYPWNPDGIAGTRRFLERLCKLHDDLRTVATPGAHVAVHAMIKKVGSDIPELKFNTAIAALMTCLNALDKETIDIELYSYLVQAVAPFAPHVAEELWEQLGNSTSVHGVPWPTVNAELLARQNVQIAIQVNGKVRAELKIAPDSTDEEIFALAMPLVEKYLSEKTIQKQIYVKNRLVTFVVS
jgi:leucyl-tRNA synthetase